jgi:YodL-like
MIKVYLMKDFRDVDRCLYGKTTIQHVLENDIVAYEISLFSFGSDMDDLAVCECMFEMLNIDHPDDYKNRSLSVGDVVMIKRKDVENYYICARMGFIKLEA